MNEESVTKMEDLAKDYMPDEIMIVCMANEVKNGSVVLQGLATPMASVAYNLAKATHAPNAVMFAIIGSILFDQAYPASILHAEFNAMNHAIGCQSPVETFRLLLGGKKGVELLRPAQIDMYGNTNNSVIGNYEKPKIRLPGAFGIPDVTPVFDDIVCYLPRHDPRVFVEKVDFLSGVGYLEGFDSRKSAGAPGFGPTKVISNLCVCGFTEKSKQMKLLTVHPGVSVDEVQKNTGFDLVIPDHVQETVPPTKKQVELIRNVIDPLGTRKLEILGGSDRFDALMEIFEKEVVQVRATSKIL